jgi:hypothetical protein
MSWVVWEFCGTFKTMQLICHQVERSERGLTSHLMRTLLPLDAKALRDGGICKIPMNVQS